MIRIANSQSLLSAKFQNLFKQLRKMKLMRSLRKAVPGATQEAIAHILIERGMFCRKSCLGGGIRVLDKEIRMYFSAEATAAPGGATQPD